MGRRLGPGPWLAPLVFLSGRQAESWPGFLGEAKLNQTFKAVMVIERLGEALRAGYAMFLQAEATDLAEMREWGR